MDDARLGASARLIAVLAAFAVALALGAAACGGDDNSGSLDSGQQPGESNHRAAVDDSTPAGANRAVDSDENQIADTMHYLREVYNASDGRAFCAKLTAAGRAEIVNLRRDRGLNLTNSTCAGIITEYSKRAVNAGAGQRPVKVLRVSVDGDRARIVVKGGLAGIRSVVPFRFVNQGGEWKLLDPISGTHNIIRVDTPGPSRQ